ncbi:MAG: hypothetical protein CL862_12585 [Cyanobium sp. NAT70]|nr:hypothetical protein [Cyanobium sp. NAT70]|tara:strand:+ start:411 stop:773 length:363 start_codon:yes stop_codon:yes gene_type:complete
MESRAFENVQLSLDLDNDMQDPKRIARRKRALVSERKSLASFKTLVNMQTLRKRVVHCDVNHPETWPEDVARSRHSMRRFMEADQHGTLAEVEERMYPQLDDPQVSIDFARELIRRGLGC